jgi:hypothetical protein
MHVARTVVPGLLAGALLLGGTSGAFAAKNKQATHRVALYGQVSNVSPTGFTLSWTPAKGKNAGTTRSVSVTTAATTKERGLKGAAALANGDYAFVAGTGSRATATVTAVRVAYSSTAFTARQRLALRGHLVRGTVVSATSSQLVITVGKAARTLTFTLDSTTKYRINKQVSTTAPAFTANEKVVVVFTRVKSTTKGAPATLVARRVLIPAKQS